MRIGILGGTFNPVHRGHLAIATEAVPEFKLDKVIFVPSFLPPHKDDADIAPPEARFQMCRLATEGTSFFSVSSLELERGGKSYSVETVKELLNIYGQNTWFYFIVGVDAILEISTWKNVEELFRHCEFIVAPRPGFETGEINRETLKHTHFLKKPVIDISSTEVRRRVKEGRSIKDLVPERVGRYIYKHKLYS